MDVKRLVMGQEVLEHKLPSGLTVVFLPKPGFAQKFAALATNYGGMDSTFIAPGHSEPTNVPDGIAHFLEHKMFEEPDGTDVSQRFSQNGHDHKCLYRIVLHGVSLHHGRAFQRRAQLTAPLRAKPVFHR